MIVPTRDELINLRETEGLTRNQIAEYYQVSLTTVRRWIKEMKVPRPSKQARSSHTNILSRFGEIIADPDDGITVMEKAQMILGSRLIDKRGVGYILDGRPTNTQNVIHAAGLKLKDEE